MLFDLEPYLPFNAFVVIVIFTMGAIVAYGEHHDNNRKDK
jgi:hypothetical protein